MRVRVCERGMRVPFVQTYTGFNDVKMSQRCKSTTDARVNEVQSTEVCVLSLVDFSRKGNTNTDTFSQCEPGSASPLDSSLSLPLFGPQRSFSRCSCCASLPECCDHNQFAALSPRLFRSEQLSLILSQRHLRSCPYTRETTVGGVGVKTRPVHFLPTSPPPPRFTRH